MARPKKIGLDYFPLDVHLEDKVELLEAEYGLIGFAILIKLWQKIYSEGYYINWNTDNALLFARKNNTDITVVNSVVNTCLLRNLFDNSLYKQHEVLTSNGIQLRYDKVCTDAKRKHISYRKELLLIKTEFTTDLPKLTMEISTQSKEEYIKEKKIKKTIVKKYFDEESFEMIIVDTFIKHLTVLNPNFKEPNRQTWADDIRKMKQIDNRSEQDIINVCRFAVNDSFWQSNILSMSKLRKQFDQLYIKSKANNKISEVATEWAID